MLVVVDSFLSFEVDAFVVRGASDWRALALSFYHLRGFHVTDTHTRRTSFFYIVFLSLAINSRY